MISPKNITVAVVTRDRPDEMDDFMASFDDTTSFEARPYFLVLHDAPNNTYGKYTTRARMTRRRIMGRVRDTGIKCSLTQLWNQCILLAPTDWVLICGDDAVFLPGWLEFLQSKIEEGALQIGLAHFGGFAVHKSIILDVGWHDERFRGGGFEDVDWQLRIKEAGIKDRFNQEANFVYLRHDKNKYKHDGIGHWNGENCEPWFKKKWKRFDVWQLDEPNFRMEPEIDWHPAATRLYETKYGRPSRLLEINKNVGNGVAILP
jgi:hypothetical protein